MPSGKTHTKINFFVLPVLIAAVYCFVTSDLTNIFIGIVVYVYGTLFLNPDADIQNQTRLFSFKGLLTLPSRLLYAPFFKHRGISHSLLLGTTSRVFILIIFAFLFYIFHLGISQFISNGEIGVDDVKRITIVVYNHILFDLVLNNLGLWMAGVFGLFLADLSHLIADKVVKYN